ncbi:hypothetical protein [Ferrimicrobium sp.]|uniref:hypothetical protein n=1 Tax=Ferrimicrobium sp. TaxID=2926050 RepID=UPI002626B8C4|nr:hypothetical protein [Ferrimicrobium sp.]
MIEPTPFSVNLFTTNDPRVKPALELEALVFLREFGNTSKELNEEYGPYENYSLILCVTDNLTNMIAGMARIILPNDAIGLKTLNDIARQWPELYNDSYFAELFLSTDDHWDIGTVAIAVGYQAPLAAGLVSLGLYQAITQLAQYCRVDSLIALLDSKVYRMTRWKFHSPFLPIPGAKAKPYLGSAASYPVYSCISDWGARLKVKDPAIYEIIYGGTGIEAAMSPMSIEYGVSLIQNIGLIVDVRATTPDELNIAPTPIVDLLDPIR